MPDTASSYFLNDCASSESSVSDSRTPVIYSSIPFLDLLLQQFRTAMRTAHNTMSSSEPVTATRTPSCFYGSAFLKKSLHWYYNQCLWHQQHFLSYLAYLTWHLMQGFTTSLVYIGLTQICLALATLGQKSKSQKAGNNSCSGSIINNKQMESNRTKKETIKKCQTDPQTQQYRCKTVQKRTFFQNGVQRSQVKEFQENMNSSPHIEKGQMLAPYDDFFQNSFSPFPNIGMNLGQFFFGKQPSFLFSPLDEPQSNWGDNSFRQSFFDSRDSFFDSRQSSFDSKRNQQPTRAAKDNKIYDL